MNATTLTKYSLYVQTKNKKTNKTKKKKKKKQHKNETVKGKVQGLPQSQVAANPWHQEEEERNTNQHMQNKQMHEKLTEQVSRPQAR